MAVHDIRGTHGSGKSWVAHHLLQVFPHRPILSEEEVHLGYEVPELSTAVVGKYKTTCGGCDGVGSGDEVVRRVKLFSQEYRHVLLEGILVAHTFGRYSALATDLKEYGYHFLFLDTPLAVCIHRVERRRKEKGNEKPLNPKNLINDWHCIWEKVRAKCTEAGHSVHVVDWRNPFPAVLELLRT